MKKVCHALLLKFITKKSALNAELGMDWWYRVGLNHRPRAYESHALTS